eukprot:scaffold253501_cov31-Tisochrysis_lutea.AAC.3
MLPHASPALALGAAHQVRVEDGVHPSRLLNALERASSESWSRVADPLMPVPIIALSQHLLRSASSLQLRTPGVGVGLLMRRTCRQLLKDYMPHEGRNISRDGACAELQDCLCHRAHTIVERACTADNSPGLG